MLILLIVPLIEIAALTVGITVATIHPRLK